MQKVQKHVISIFLILFIFNCKAQNNEDEYRFLNKVIHLTKNSEDSILYKLNVNKNVNTEPLSKYYRYRYLNEPIYNFIKGYDKEKDSIFYDNKSSESYSGSWDIKYSILDKNFSKEDVEFILENFQNSKWNSSKLDSNIKVIQTVVRNDKNKKNLYYSGNTISQPLYNIDKNYVIIQHHSAKTFTTLFIFKKEKDDWIEVGNIKNLW